MATESPVLGVHKESEVTPGGIYLNFINPEFLRAFILSPEKWGRTTLAERMSGIREVRLGEFLLDGQLFESVRFILIVEPDRDPRGGRPTTIIRADFQLGDLTSSNIATFQAAKSSREEAEDLLGPITRQFDTIVQPKEEEIVLTNYTKNTARIHPPLEAETFPKLPLVLLQVWDKDVGPDSISISLFSYQRYDENWLNRTDTHKRKVEAGWETDYDEVDRWHFGQPVGVSVYEAENFYRSLGFLGKAFPLIVQAFYQAEEVDVPTLNLEIESPLVSKDREEIVFSDIGGQKAAVDFMRALVEMEKSGKQLPQKPIVLLAGPPGNGKSSLAQATANELGGKLLVITTRDLSPSAEESDFQSIVEAGYFEAKAAARLRGKAVYCIEGLETILGKNPRSHDRFLNLMDFWASDSDSNVLVIATSNFPEQLHPGIVNRFQRINMSQPNSEGLAEILEIHVEKLTKLVGRVDLFGNINFRQIAQMMENLMGDFSGRDVEALLAKAYYLRKLQAQEGSSQQPIDSKFLLSLIPRRRIGFQTLPSPRP